MILGRLNRDRTQPSRTCITWCRWCGLIMSWSKKSRIRQSKDNWTPIPIFRKTSEEVCVQNFYVLSELYLQQLQVLRSKKEGGKKLWKEVRIDCRNSAGIMYENTQKNGKDQRAEVLGKCASAYKHHTITFRGRWWERWGDCTKKAKTAELTWL